jgi:hypothetical protein
MAAIDGMYADRENNVAFAFLSPESQILLQFTINLWLSTKITSPYSKCNVLSDSLFLLKK